MPVRHTVARRLVQAVLGTHVFDGRTGQCVSMPDADYQRAVDAADFLFEQVVRAVDWNRLLIEAGGRHLALHMDKANGWDRVAGRRVGWEDAAPCAECVREALLADAKTLDAASLERWSEVRVAPHRAPSDWMGVFASLVVRHRRVDEGVPQTLRSSGNF